MTFNTRFAPSPTGPLHLGHAYSALLAHDMARAAGGQFFLRIEDLDQSRVRPEWEELIYEDLTWLGIRWDAPPLRQSDRAAHYRDALTGPLRDHIFACTCNRRDIMTAANAPQDGEPAMGPDGIVYPGTCVPQGAHDMTGLDWGAVNLRLRVDTLDQGPYHFVDTGVNNGTHIFDIDEFSATIGAVVLWRRGYAAYHLASVVDDAAQGITHVIRGLDLFEATQIHVVLQALLGVPTPTYHHHRLITDDTGKRLAKRHDAKAIRLYRDQGYSVEAIRDLVGLAPVPS